uniref:Uncharacterized protein n=1 Tax=Cucumis melo TaxID=3656 RepID=A0A9I9DRS1_CUCME
MGLLLFKVKQQERKPPQYSKAREDQYENGRTKNGDWLRKEEETYHLLCGRIDRLKKIKEREEMKRRERWSFGGLKP